MDRPLNHYGKWEEILHYARIDVRSWGQDEVFNGSNLSPGEMQHIAKRVKCKLSTIHSPVAFPVMFCAASVFCLSWNLSGTSHQRMNLSSTIHALLSTIIREKSSWSSLQQWKGCLVTGKGSMESDNRQSGEHTCASQRFSISSPREKDPSIWIAISS